MAAASFKDSKLLGHDLESELGRCFDVSSISELIQLIDSQVSEMKIALKVNEESQDLWNLNIKTTKSNMTVDGYLNENIVLLTENEWLAEESLNFEGHLKTLSRNLPWT